MYQNWFSALERETTLKTCKLGYSSIRSAPAVCRVVARHEIVKVTQQVSRIEAWRHPTRLDNPDPAGLEIL